MATHEPERRYHSAVAYRHPGDEHALRAAGVEPNPIVPLKSSWAAPRSVSDGVYKQGAVLLAGDLLLEALNGDAVARQQLKQRQQMRKQQSIRSYVAQQQQFEAKAERAQWSADKGMQGQRATCAKAVVLRRTAELSSEKVGRVPKGAVLHVLEMGRPNQDGVRRALVQDVWGKNSGWMTAVDVDGEQNLVPLREDRSNGGEEDLGRAGWLQQVRAQSLLPSHTVSRFASLESARCGQGVTRKPFSCAPLVSVVLTPPAPHLTCVVTCGSCHGPVPLSLAGLPNGELEEAAVSKVRPDRTAAGDRGQEDTGAPATAQASPAGYECQRGGQAESGRSQARQGEECLWRGEASVTVVRPRRAFEARRPPSR
jgi:hypothetical protein